MPRANRHFLPGHLWHITHRCHERTFLLKFARDRRAWLGWLFEAKKRLGLCVLNYAVTSNHIHLLVKDGGGEVIARSMQLIAGRMGQQYNLRKKRQGAFWEDRYHATAVEGDEHLRRCLVYIDLNMVRAGVVKHPAQWAHGGYREIQNPPQRVRIVDLAQLARQCGFDSIEGFQRAHRAWVEEELVLDRSRRDARWSEAIAVGSHSFVEQIQRELALKAKYRSIDEADAQGTCALREPANAYTGSFAIENGGLRAKNVVSWR
jgi:putative transposase